MKSFVEDFFFLIAYYVYIMSVNMCNDRENGISFEFFIVIDWPVTCNGGSYGILSRWNGGGAYRFVELLV